MSATLEQLEGMTEDAYERGKAAGYAAAVADVVAMLVARRNRGNASLATIGECNDVIRAIAAGAHVGAAKKGAT